MRFNENVKFGKVLRDLPTQDEIRHLPQFYRGSADYVYRLGGPFLRRVINELPLAKDFKYVSVDTRVHMLMPGWLPCIGGWHCDDFYRPLGDQPDLEGIRLHNRYSKHHTLVVGKVAMTEFVNESFEMEIPSPAELAGANLYGVMSAAISSGLSSIDSDGLPRVGAPPFRSTRKCASGQLVHFDSFDFHRGTPSEGSGWRLFVRVTESNHREPKDEIRVQSQVYLKSFEAGW